MKDGRCRVGTNSSWTTYNSGKVYEERVKDSGERTLKATDKRVLGGGVTR